MKCYTIKNAVWGHDDPIVVDDLLADINGENDIIIDAEFTVIKTKFRLFR